VNMAPADLKKEGSAYDLPLALGILAASEQIISPDLEKYVIMGELSLDGGIKPIKGVLPIAIEARKQGFKGFILPRHNAREAAVVNNLDVIGVDKLSQAVDFLTDPPLDPGLKFGYKVLLEAAVATIPRRLRGILGVARMPGSVAAGRAATAGLRWALGNSPSWHLALVRCGATIPDRRFRQALQVSP